MDRDHVLLGVREVMVHLVEVVHVDHLQVNVSQILEVEESHHNEEGAHLGKEVLLDRYLCLKYLEMRVIGN